VRLKKRIMMLKVKNELYSNNLNNLKSTSCHAIEGFYSENNGGNFKNWLLVKQIWMSIRQRNFLNHIIQLKIHNMWKLSLVSAKKMFVIFKYFSHHGKEIFCHFSSLVLPVLSTDMLIIMRKSSKIINLLSLPITEPC